MHDFMDFYDSTGKGRLFQKITLSGKDFNSYLHIWKEQSPIKFDTSLICKISEEQFLNRIKRNDLDCWFGLVLPPDRCKRLYAYKQKQGQLKLFHCLVWRIKCLILYVTCQKITTGSAKEIQRKLFSENNNNKRYKRTSINPLIHSKYIIVYDHGIIFPSFGGALQSKMRTNERR